MSRFFSILVATFISVLAALAGWDYVKSHLAELEAERIAAEAKSKIQEKRAVIKRMADGIKYEWKVEEQTNPVTGEIVATATRFSEEIDSAVTFRCYGLKQKTFDTLIVFPKEVQWSSNDRGFYSDMHFKIDGGELLVVRVAKNSPSVAIPVLEFINAEEKSLGITSLKELYESHNKAVRGFKKIGTASKFAASISDGTVYQQTIEIDLAGIESAIKPVLAMCGRDEI